MRFSEPLWFLLLFALLPLLALQRRRGTALIVPSLNIAKETVKDRKRSLWTWLLRHLLFLMRVATLILLVCAMARPQSGRTHDKQRHEGLDMMLVIDTSKSMLALDFLIEGRRQDRLFVAKKVLAEFIRNRPDDRLGLTIFGSQAFAYAPLTLDHDVLLRYLDEVEIGMAGDSTAIGDAIGVAVNRIKELKAKNKIIILLTDGANQAGKVDPGEAAKAAKAMGVRIYTIGIGSNDLVPVATPLGYRNVRFELDEALLQEIAKTTDGRYFRASDTETLMNVYKTIDSLEKSQAEVKEFRQADERYGLFLWPALAFLILEVLLSLTRFRRVP